MVDVDYAAGITDLGTGITGGVAGAGAELDADAVRRVSYNVGAVAAITPTGLQLAAPLLGGAPASGARVQKVVGFVDREGASFFQEWSALFALEENGGGQVFFYYPAAAGVGAGRRDRDGRGEWSERGLLHAEFAALVVTDANDGESVVCYRSYIPAANGGRR